MRELGGHVVWVKNATNDTRESWSVFHDWLHTPQRRDRRYATMDLAHEGHALWAELDAKARGRADREEALQRLHSGLVRHQAANLRERGIDTLLITGTATNVCCEKAARDAMMLRFKVVWWPTGSPPRPTKSTTPPCRTLQARFAIKYRHTG